MEAQTQKPEPSRRLDLLLDTDEGRPLPVVVQGREKLRGTPSVSGGSLALVLDQPLKAPSHTPPYLLQ